MGKFKDLTGKSFGQWTVAGMSKIQKSKDIAWDVICDCGSERSVVGTVLRDGRSKSCGCTSRERTIAGITKHGATGGDRTSPLWRTWSTWSSMRDRCNNPNNTGYRYYGGRGVTVCERWSVFENFLADMGERPSIELSIDRINCNGNYEPANCRWATDHEQAINQRKRTSKFVEEIAVSRRTYNSRLKSGWDPIRAATLPPLPLAGRPMDLRPCGDRSGARKHPESLRRGATHPKTRFNDDDVRGIRDRSAAGVTPSTLAAEHGVTTSTICKIVLRQTWKRL